MVSTVKKIQYFFGKQIFILPFPVHIPVKSDISGEYDRSFALFHPSVSPVTIAMAPV
jgi:hypothetical protein